MRGLLQHMGHVGEWGPNEQVELKGSKNFWSPMSHATSFGAGEATAGLRRASDFLFGIDSGQAWDDVQELLKTPAVLGKHGQDYEHWVAEVDDTNADLRRAKEMLKDAMAGQAPQPEEAEPDMSQE